MTKNEFYEQMRAFLREVQTEGGGAVPERIDEDDNLFDLGLVTSFTMIRMIVFVEQITGTPIDLGEHELEVFYTLRGLYRIAVEERVAP
ncbi:acyl carrier protein [Cellulosimicrobium marinum]|uniref:acyl carrier protein n=1 Tax=Cellulosimicrobium marinum TaxID=1638992 RepID=UPI001E5435AD|nr:acyl carrier protein [Cellulosimicrobium marinum]MCB7135711.1 acyl carrier protein [Cellulosimicrobium marinum]